MCLSQDIQPCHPGPKVKQPRRAAGKFHILKHSLPVSGDFQNYYAGELLCPLLLKSALLGRRQQVPKKDHGDECL